MGIKDQIQFILSDDGEKKFAVLPIDVFDRLTNVYEELEAVKAYDNAKKSKDKTIPLDQMLKEVNEARKDV